METVSFLKHKRKKKIFRILSDIAADNILEH